MCRRAVSDLTSIAMHTDMQVALVDVQGTATVPTIAALLASHPADAPFLSIARGGPTATTFGQVLKFLSPGGGGDLTKLGVKPGEVVAYMAPPGGSAASASVCKSSCKKTPPNTCAWVTGLMSFAGTPHVRPM